LAFLGTETLARVKNAITLGLNETLG